MRGRGERGKLNRLEILMSVRETVTVGVFEQAS